MKRKIENRNIRTLYKSGSGSYSLTLPIEIIRAFKWREKQKVTVKKSGKNIIISDWQ